MTKAGMILGIPAALSYLLAMLGDVSSAEAQRYRPTQPVTFYAAPNGVDASNNCLSQANPCTPPGAHSIAFRDWDFASSSCTIRLAPGTYSGTAATVAIAGQYVGTHLCQVYGHVDAQGNCIDRTAVVLDVPAGQAAFDVQDLMMTSVACLTVQGENAIGFFGRQHVIIDLADINCGAIETCLSLTKYAAANFARWTWISGDQTTFVGADRHSQVLFAGGSGIAMTGAHKVTYFLLSYNNSMIEFTGGNVQFSSPGYLSGSQCKPSWGGAISANGIALPCEISFGPDGKVY